MDGADSLFARAVDDAGNVDYNEALAGAELDDALAVVASADLASMQGADRYAFLINAYNLCTLDVVRRRLWGRGRGRSLRNPFWWLVFFLFTPVRVAGRRMSLYRLEFRLLKPHLREDPRGHFALVCASTGCPPLRGGVFHGDGLDAELDAAGRAFCQPGGGYEANRDEGVLWLNRIFKWYAKDFEVMGGSVSAWKQYAPSGDVEWVEATRPAVSYMKYDWGLNASTD